MQTIVTSRMSADIILKVTDFHYESIFKQSYIFNPAFLSIYHNRKAEHIRYRYVWELFLFELETYIGYRKQDIDEKIEKGSFPYQPSKPFEPITINFGVPVITNPDEDIMVHHQATKQSYHYELSKLMKRDHPLCNVQSFKELFHDNHAVFEELLNMEKNFYSDLEYFASYEYIRFLLGENDEFLFQ